MTGFKFYLSDEDHPTMRDDLAVLLRSLGGQQEEEDPTQAQIIIVHGNSDQLEETLHEHGIYIEYTTAEGLSCQPNLRGMKKSYKISFSLLVKRLKRLTTPTSIHDIVQVITKPEKPVTYSASIVVLCQGYLAVHAATSGYASIIENSQPPDTAFKEALKLMGWSEKARDLVKNVDIHIVQDPSWWKSVLQFGTYNGFSLNVLKEEWDFMTSDVFPDELPTFVAALLNDNMITDHNIVARVYCLLAAKLQSTFS